MGSAMDVMALYECNACHDTLDVIALTTCTKEVTIICLHYSTRRKQDSATGVATLTRTPFPTHGYQHAAHAKP